MEKNKEWTVMKIILDTNFLIDVVRFKIDLDQLYPLVGRYELFTVSPVFDELSKISGKTSREGKCARIALQLIERRRVEILKVNGKADEAILELADRMTMVATNDIELKKSLKERGAKTIYIRARKYLAIS